MHPPAFSQHTQFLDRVEDFTIQELVPELGGKAFAVAVLPRRARLDVQRLCACACQPLAQVPGYKLRAVIGSKMSGNAFHHPDVSKCADYPGTRPTPFPTDQQALPRGLIDQVQQSYRSAIVCSCTHEVVAPHVVDVRRPEPYARAIVEPQPASWLLLLGYLQPFTTPDPLNPVLADLPARPLQQRRDAAVPIAAIPAGQLNDGLGKSIFVIAPCRPVALRATWLVHQMARPPLRQTMLLLGMINRTAPSFRA